jgi:hypothetical protein
MIPVRKITITRAEGPTVLCGKLKEFTSFLDANTWLLSQDETFPKHGGYDKHDFKVEFEDGEIYEGRLDCKHHSCKNNDLDIKEHIASFVLWMSGRHPNPWCGKEKYDREMMQESAESKKEFSDFYDKYLSEA